MYNLLFHAIESQGITINRLARLSNIYPSDLYGAIKGTRPFYPAWKKRVADALGMNEEELFED